MSASLRWRAKNASFAGHPRFELMLARVAKSATSISEIGPEGGSLARGNKTLTDDEGTFLSLLLRVAPATAYQIRKVYADSPVSNFGTSNGKISPLIRRLRDRNLIRGVPLSKGRGSETLECTAAGTEAVRSWVKSIRDNHILLEDPLRTKVQSFGLLTRAEQLEWVADASLALRSKLDEVELYSAAVDVPYKALVHDNAVASIRARLQWLERLKREIKASRGPAKPLT